MRTVSPAFRAHIEQEHTTLCRLLTVTRSDGLVLRFTDSTRDVVYGGETFRSDYSFTCSAITTTLNGVGQNVTLTVIMDDVGFREEDLLARKFDNALADIIVVNYNDPDSGFLRYITGTFGNISVTDKLRATIELVPVGSADDATRSIPNQIYQRTCRAQFGDDQCKFDVVATGAAFAIVTADGLHLETGDLLQADGWWDNGFIEWTLGSNSGTISFIRKFTTGTIYLGVAPDVAAVEVGDEGLIYRGCNKSLAQCVSYANTDNFRGEPDIPTAVTQQTPSGAPIYG